MSIEAMRQALEALEHEAKMGGDNAYQRERDALRIAIAEAEKQEPFGYFQYALHFDAWVQNRDSNKGVAFYTTPPAAQRQWVGLTNDEIKEIIGPWGDTPIRGYTRKLFDQIEAKLKEKNNG